MNKKICFLFALAVIVGIAALAFILVYNYDLIPQIGEEKPKVSAPKASPQTPEEKINDWELYRNEEYGYEIMYKKDWRLFKEKGETTIFYEATPEGFKIKDLMNIRVRSFRVIDFTEEDKEAMEKKGILSMEKITIDGKEGYMLHMAEQEKEDLPELIFYELYKDDLVFTIFIADLDSAEDIISTFKFLD